MTESWTRGEVITVRHIWRGKVWFAHPGIVVEDTAERLVLFEPAGSHRQWSHFDFDSGAIEPPREQARHSTDALIIMEVGVAHAVSLFWREGGGAFVCWYVDMQTPFRRAGGGIVTWDQALDVVVSPDLQWAWKDEDHLARMMELGWATEDEVRAIREEGARVVARIDRHFLPFNEDWPNWRPDPAWPPPRLPLDWDAPC
jgi:hypothetical protein